MTQATLHFDLVHHNDESGDYYVVSGREIALVTDGQTIDEALSNLREAIEVHFEGEDVDPFPRIVIVHELAYA